MQYSFYVSPANAFQSQHGQGLSADAKPNLVTPDLNVYNNASGRVIYAPNYYSSWFKLKQTGNDNGTCYLEPEVDDLLIGDRITVDLDITGVTGKSQFYIGSYSGMTDTMVSNTDKQLITETTHHFKLSMYIDDRFSKYLNEDKILKRLWMNIRVYESTLTQSPIEVVMENVKITVDTSNQAAGCTAYDNALLSSGDMWRAIYDNKALSTSFSNENYSTTADALTAKTAGFSLTPQGGLMFPLTDKVGGFKGITIQRIPYVSMQAFSGCITYETDKYVPIGLRSFSIDDTGKIINNGVSKLNLKPDNKTGINKQYFYFDTRSLYKLNADDKGRLAYFNIEFGSSTNDPNAPDFNINIHSIMVHQNQTTTQTHKYVSATVPKGSEA